LDQILAQLSTINSRLDLHGQRITLLEKRPIDQQLPESSETSPRTAAPVGVMHSTRSASHDRIDDGGYRRPNVSFPHYDGESDPLPWINKCETYFRGMRTPEKVWQTSLHLDGVATGWFHAVERDTSDVLTWSCFVEFTHMRFGPPLRSNGMADLKDLRRIGTVEDYQRQFLSILCRCEDMTRLQQAQMFTADLGESLRTDVELLTPTTLQRAMYLARAYECRMDLSSTPSRTPFATSKPTASAAKPSSSATSRPSLCRLSPEEVAAKRASGECYHCSEKYSIDHKCAARGVFLLELDGEDTGTTDTLAEEMGISLHALTGIYIVDTLKLKVSINGVALIALVDSGSTDIFIRDAIVPRLGLHVTPTAGLLVKVANGEKMLSGGICSQTPLTVGEKNFTTTCYTLPLDGFDVVLGVQWLRSLGPFICNFEKLTLSFWCHGHMVRWTDIGGSPPPCNALDMAHKLLDTLLLSFEDLFVELQGLPPPRRHDHRIRLLPGIVAVRLYRSQLLKDEIE
jgi:hypothetical protein